MGNERIFWRDAIALVKESVITERPLSLIRLGDGEGPLMGWPEFKHRGAIWRSMRYWFGGVHYTDGEIGAIANHLRGAIRNADVIGVPSEDQQRRKHEYRAVGFYARKFDLFPEHALLTGANLHVEAYKEGWYGKLISGLSSITVITCRDVAGVIKDATGISEVNWLKVPVEAQTIDFRMTNHWPDRFEEIRLELAIPQPPGHLFLVGAGVLGKVYCSWVKAEGGVALDIGSIFDVWAGVKSRSYQDKTGFGF